MDWLPWTLMIYQIMFRDEETATAAVQFLDQAESRCRFGDKSSLLFQRPSPLSSEKEGSHHTAAPKMCYSSDDLLWILNPPFLYHDCSWLFLLQLEVWKFSEIISAKFIDCFYEPVHTCSQGMLCITCSPEVEMWQFKTTVNMEWLCPEGTMNLERELPCQKPRVTSGCKGVWNSGD